MTDEQQGTPTDVDTPPDAAGVNGSASKGAPTVTARRPISKAEYARTTKQSPDATSIIPAVRDDAPPPVADDDTQVHAAVTDEIPPKPAPAKKASTKKAPVAKKAPAPKVAPPADPRPDPVPTSQDTQVAAAAVTVQKAAEAAQAAPEPGPDAESGARSARLRLTHVEPWSVTKLAFVVSVALMIVSVVAVTVFWVVLQITGVWDAINDTVAGVLSDNSTAFDITDRLGFGRVVGLTLLVSALNVVFMTALATIAAHLYNLAAGLLGGIELTFGERK